MAYGAATTGVDGLEVILAEAGISSWYNYYRENGLVHVNYKSGGVRMNVTFRLSGNRLKKPVVDEGIYRRRITKQK